MQNRVRSTHRRKERKKVKLNCLLIELCNSSRRAVILSGETKERNFHFTTPESVRSLLADSMKLLIEIILLITRNWGRKRSADWCLVNNQNKSHRQNTDELLLSSRTKFPRSNVVPRPSCGHKQYFLLTAVSLAR